MQEAEGGHAASLLVPSEARPGAPVAPKTAPKLTEYLDIIEQETGAADRIIGNLIEMTRAREALKQAVDLGRTVREVFHRVDLDSRKHMRPQGRGAS